MSFFTVILRWICRPLGHMALSHAPGAFTKSALSDTKNPAPEATAQDSWDFTLFLLKRE
jgi:hypothetical protein